MTVRGREGAGAAGSKAPRASEAVSTENPEGGEERRGSASRVPFDALVAVVEGAAGGFEAQSVDVSMQGMRLRTAYVPEVGEKLACRFDGMGTEIVVDGEVLWRREETKGGEFGVRFVGLDEATAAAVRAMCMTLEDPGEEEASAAEGSDQVRVAKGSRVRLHIEGLGSPMKARVRTAAAKELSVGSNLEFLKVGRALELEDVEQGRKREAIIDDVKVDVDPATNIPQLVVTLRFDKTIADEPSQSRRSAPEKRASDKRDKGDKRENAAAKPASKRPAPPSEAAEGAEALDGESEGEEKASAAAAMMSRARGAGQAALTKVGPAIAGAGARAKSALGGVLDLVRQRQAERASATKASAPRRTTAPAPGGGVTAEGKRLVRGHTVDEEETAETPQGTRRAAVMGGALGLFVVLAIFGAVRLTGRGHVAAGPATAQSGVSPVAALPTSNEPIAAPGTPTANIPLFGATPLSTTEPAVAAGAPSASASAVASADPAAAPSGEDDDPPGDSAPSGSMKEWGTGSVSHPVVLKIKMDGAIERISGSAGAQGFTVTVPGRRSLLPSSADLSKKDKRLASVNVINTSRGAEVTVQFKDGVPPYVAKVKGDRLEIAIGKEGKVAKSKKKSKKAKHEE